MISNFGTLVVEFFHIISGFHIKPTVVKIIGFNAVNRFLRFGFVKNNWCFSGFLQPIVEVFSGLYIAVQLLFRKQFGFPSNFSGIVVYLLVKYGIYIGSGQIINMQP